MIATRVCRSKYLSAAAAAADKTASD